MARVPVPQQGQPLDLAYIATLTNAVNQLSEESSALSQNNNFIYRARNEDTPAAYKIYGMQFFTAEYFYTGNGTSIQKTESFSPYNFQKPPIVVASLVGVTPAETQATVSLKDITSGSFSLSINFPETENFSTSVSVIAIGLPSTF